MPRSVRQFLPCRRCGDIFKGFEHAKGDYVLLASKQTRELTQFIDAHDIDMIDEGVLAATSLVLHSGFPTNPVSTKSIILHLVPAPRR